MKFKLLNAVFVVVILSLTSSNNIANAGLITLGGLSANDDGSGFITDSRNNREWTRWDQTLNLTFAELQAELTPNGRYEGWSLAGIEDMNLLEKSLFQGQSRSTSCTWGGTCGFMDRNELIPIFGKDGQGSTVNRIFFLSDNDYGKEIGVMQWNHDGIVSKTNDWAAISDADSLYFRMIGGFQLYRELNVVPEPSTLAIFALSLIGLTTRRFKKD